MIFSARSTRRSPFARTMLALAASTSIAMASACGSDLPTAPTDVPGTYFLRTIDGLALPVTVPNPRDHLIVINSVTATLNANDTYALAGTGTEDGNASTELTDAGTFTQSGSTLHFTSTSLDGATYSAHGKVRHGYRDAPRGLPGFGQCELLAAVREAGVGSAAARERRDEARAERSRLALPPDDCCCAATRARCTCHDSRAAPIRSRNDSVSFSSTLRFCSACVNIFARAPTPDLVARASPAPRTRGSGRSGN